jgi:glycosyltransferase involved in cell wall biosynthesis
MRILHVVQLYHPVPTGAARYFAEIGERLVREGHQVTVLATDAYDLEHLWAPGRRAIAERTGEHGGVQIVRLPVWRAPLSRLLYPGVRRLMVELSRIPRSEPLLRRLAGITPRIPAIDAFFAQAEPFDLVHTTNITLDFAILPAHAYAKRRGIPLLCTPFVHLGEPDNDAIVRYYAMRHQLALLRECDRVLTMTGIEGAYLAQRGIARSRLHKVGVGVDPAAIQGGDGARFRAEQQIEGPLVLFIGALARDKGAITLIEALQRLWAEGRDVTLALIGAPLDHFERFFATLPEAQRAKIRLLRYASEEVKRDALAAADIFAMPSRTDSFGIVYLEAWCYGVPVIGARAGGVPGVIADEKDGLLVPYGDTQALAGAIARLLDNPEEARRLGAAGREKVLRELTWDHVYARVRAVYVGGTTPIVSSRLA